MPDPSRLFPRISPGYPKWEGVALVLLTGVAAVLRLFNLGIWSFWGDEIRTLHWLQNRIPFLDHGWSLTKYAARIVITNFGVSEFNARIVPAVIGIASIPILFLLVKRMFGKQVALTTALLLTISPWHIYWSQNARFYTSMLLLFSIALFLFLEGLVRYRLKLLLIALLVWGLSLTEQISAVQFLPIAAIYSLYWFGFPPRLTRGLKKWKWRSAIFLAVGVVIIWSLPYVSQPGQYEKEFSQYLAFGSNPLFLASCAAYYIGVPTLAIAIMSGIYLIAMRNRLGVLVSIGALGPVLFVTLGSTFLWLGCRHQFASLICWLILASFGIVEIINKTPRNLRLLAIAPLAILVTSSLSNAALYFFVQNGNRENGKAALEYVSQNADPEDLIFVYEPLIAEYYLGRSVDLLQEGIALPRIRAACKSWFVEDQYSADRNPMIFQWIIENAKLVMIDDVVVSAKLYKMRVYLFEGDCDQVD